VAAAYKMLGMGRLNRPEPQTMFVDGGVWPDVSDGDWGNLKKNVQKPLDALAMIVDGDGGS